MKKIAALIVMAALFAGTVSAYDVSWGGWLDTRGSFTTLSGDNVSDDDAKTDLNFGATTLDLTLNVTGEGFGATATLESWSDVNVASPSPSFINTYIYSNFSEFFTLYAGLGMQVINYSPGPILEGGILFDDSFGLGLGRQDYTGAFPGGVYGDFFGENHYSGSSNGLIAEVKAAGLSAAVVLHNEAAAEMVEDVTANNIDVIAKYSMPILDASAGLYLREMDKGSDDAEAKNGIFVAVDVKAVEGLTAQVKFETARTDMYWNGLESAVDFVDWTDDVDVDVTAISANLGYALDVAAINTEINYLMVAEDKDNFVEASTAWQVAAQIKPFVIPVVSTNINLRFAGSDVEDSPLYSAFGFDVSKGFGNVNNTLSFAYMTNDADGATSTTEVRYQVTMWF